MHATCRQLIDGVTPWGSVDIRPVSQAIRSLGTAMTRADRQLTAGRISPADHEANWRRVNDRPAPGALEAGVR